MSAADSSGVGGINTDKTVQQISVHKTTGTFPIDLAPKIAHIKPTTETIKVAPIVQTNSQQATTYSQVRVVVPPGASIMPQTMIKQIDGSATGIRTQITGIPARTISQTSITMARPLTPTTYLPRASVTATNLQAQRLGAPIRTSTPPTVAGLAGNFVRGTTVTRNSTSPATTGLQPPTSTWMTTPNTGQVQLLRAISHQPRQRLVTQNISATNGNTGVVTVGQGANLAVQTQPNQASIQSVTSQPTQQTFVATLATVLPPRQQTATLVYSNVSNSQPQQYNPSSAAQRFTVAASLAGNQRQIRPIQLGNRAFSTGKISVGGMNTTSISIRAPVPVLTPTINAANVAGTIQARHTSGNVNLPTTSLSTTRIIQLQQQQPGAGTQIIGSGQRITNNLMLQPIIMNAAAGSKIGIRPPTTIQTKIQPSLTITQLGLGKIATAQQAVGVQSLKATNLQGATINPSSTNTSNVVTSVTGNIVQQQQTHQVNTAQQQNVNVNVSNSQQPITQIVTVNQNIGNGSTGQIITNQNVAASAAVVPLAIASRAPNVLTGTITPIKSAAISVPPIAKVLPQQQQHHPTQNQQNNQTGEINTSSHQPTSVYIHTRASGNSGATAVIPNSGNFLPATGTFYYESVPANSVNASTGVLSLSTTTITSTVSNTSTVTSTNLGTGLVTSMPYSPAPGTFTVVPSTNRSIGQIQIPSSTSSGPTQCHGQIQTLRFTPQHLAEQNVSVAAQAYIQSQQSQNVQQTHMLIPVQTSIKIPAVTTKIAGSPPRSTSVQSAINTMNAAFLRKRDNDGSPIRAAKNLGPTLLSMAPNQISSIIADRSKDRERPISPHERPGSSGGSTTVSANSSPGVDQQMNEELSLMTPMNVRMTNDSHFNPINEMYANHLNATSQQNSVRLQSQHQLQHQTSTSSSNGNLECTPRKKPKRPTNENQQQNQLPSSVSQHHNQHHASNNPQQQSVTPTGIHEISMNNKTNINNVITFSNKENTKPPEIIIKKPRPCNLLDSYKQNWKAANNHFQRYSDVKPRDERRPSVMDLANQAHVVQKINGWKIYHLSAQMEDLCEIETQVHEKLQSMLKQLDTHGQSQDIDRVNDLIKGNMQRSKVIVDGVNEARTQIMKIFDHKSHVSDIIHRCASKRNFKKREKT